MAVWVSLLKDYQWVYKCCKARISYVQVLELRRRGSEKTKTKGSANTMSDVMIRSPLKIWSRIGLTMKIGPSFSNLLTHLGSSNERTADRRGETAPTPSMDKPITSPEGM
ncbi:hypothetical protein Tco_0985229 [Tanacetum coccineum]